MAKRRRTADCVDVAVADLAELEHRCDGCRPRQRCCCASFDVCVTSAEIARIDGIMPLASLFRPTLREDDGFANVFDEAEEGLHSIDTDEEGACAFGFWRDGTLQCSIHAAAVAMGLPWERLKPRVCSLWPLSLSSAGPLTLSYDTEAFAFHCNRRRPRGATTLDPGVSAILRLAFGAEFERRVAQAAAQGLRRARVPLRGAVGDVL